jgi:phosphoribosylglycinamide formyltransferase-1
MKSYVILISGRGSNMQALLDSNLPGQCAVVISNRPDAIGLQTAAALGVATAVVDDRQFATREAFDAALGDVIERHAPDLILLAGFMRILGEDFVKRFSGRMLNIHPSLLPDFPGIKTHARALAAGARVHGCTVHFVSAALDGGPIIAHTQVPVVAGDDENTLAARVLAEEHRLYPRVARWFLEDRLRFADGHISLDGKPLPPRGLDSAADSA